VVAVELTDIDAFSPSLEKNEITLDVVVINELMDMHDVENNILSHDHEDYSILLDVDSEENRTIVGSSAATNLREQLPIVSTSRTKECVLQKVDLIDLTDD
jgi:hypothetical protein